MIDITLNDGHRIPALGFGVYQTPPEETAIAVRTALQTGYRLIDTAAAYLNERQVGEGIRASGIPREKVFIETKVWITDYGYERTLHAFDKSIRKLGVDYLDLLILHQALPTAFEMTIDAYRALETLQADGRVRSIGVSNFMVEHLNTLLERTSVVPALNQIEVHPYFSQPEVREADRQHSILGGHHPRRALHRVSRTGIDKTAQRALDGVERNKAVRPVLKQGHQIGGN